MTLPLPCAEAVITLLSTESGPMFLDKMLLCYLQQDMKACSQRSTFVGHMFGSKSSSTACSTASPSANTV